MATGESREPSLRAAVTLLVLDLLLMAFSIVMWQLGNETLGTAAGAGAIALAADVARRAVGDSPERTRG